MSTNAPAVYQAIASITGAMAVEGISKDRKNKEQNYSFRGIDDVYNALSANLAEYKLCVLPRVIERDLVERKTAKGNPLFSVTLKVEYDFVSAIDGSKHTVVSFGEAMDTADKATNKAMSAAYKYACIQTFCIPTEGDNDADDTPHEVAASSAPKKPNMSMALDREQAEQIYDQALKKLAAASTLDELKKTWSAYEKTLKSLPEDLRADLVAKKDECKDELTRTAD